MFEANIDPAEVQYMGIPDDVETCVLAVDTVVNSENPPRKASIVTWRKDRKEGMDEHLFLFWNWNYVPLTVVHSGFASGYGGGGPHAFSEALRSIFYREIPTNEILLGESEFSAIEDRRLTPEIIERLRTADDIPLEFPWHWIMPRHSQLREGEFWAQWHKPKMVFDFLDDSISKECRKLYPINREEAVFVAFKVVEERIRTLMNWSDTCEEDQTTDRLITKALNPTRGILTDKGLSSSEREGMYLLFKGAFQFVRNPRAHRIMDSQDEQLSIELMCLADLLLRILPEKPLANAQRQDP